MKTTINLEFSQDEMESFVSNVLTRSVIKLIGDTSSDPVLLQSIIGSIQQGLGMMASKSPGGPVSRGGYAYPPGGYSPGYAPPPPSPSGNVRPIREPGAMDECFVMEETRHTEAGWICHLCATFNIAQRTVCRHCAHSCCVPGAPQPPPPQSSHTEEPPQ